MDAMYIPPGRSRRNTPKMMNLHHLRVNYFCVVIDMQIQELNDRFFEVDSELCLCIACLCPDDSFSVFDKNKLIRLVEYYSEDISLILLHLMINLKLIYLICAQMKTLEDCKVLVILLVTLALILSVATTTVERVFSVTDLVKTRLRNQIRDQSLNDNSVIYIEKDIFNEIDNDVIIRCFQNIKMRREQL
ncbi:uncharacterized protein LOC111373425 [Olea europaea var. sylvestris]|uniref:uncharacterized protein LOC111373425 n=1 Tax=Olea europaea var. sylvestris TaxID=158386 RepID=UPI000C1D6EAE|nr:uncharacterized protein LOC111373425 [Olea europaea var. sylvestris]